MHMHSFGGRLYLKYVVYFAALIAAVLLAGGASDLYFSYYKTRDSTAALHREKAAAAAIRIEQFVRELEQHIGWTNLLPRGTDAIAQRHVEFIKLLRQAPAITDVLWLDARGREQLRISRLAMDRLRSGTDFSQTPAFQKARTEEHYRGPVYFREGTEPYMTLAVAAGGGVTLVEVNLKFVWDVITGIHFGKTGHAYVIDTNNHLISHPDISLVLKKTDLSSLPQVQRARAVGNQAEVDDSEDGYDTLGHAVLAAYARIEPLNWTVFVEQDRQEAFAPLYASMLRTGLLVLLGLVLALGASAVLARRMVRPIRALQDGAARIGAGELDHRIDIHTGDELEVLAEEFDQMAARLRESYSGLEQKVNDRTEALVAANRAKSRFLAAASHDLRQPMHALGLFVAQLKDRVRDLEAAPLILRVEAAVTALQGLLDALLDVSRLDAGVVTPNVTDFSANTILVRMESGFAADATNRGLRFRIVRSTLALRSDPTLLERILINLVANALRYTESGGILIGCRRRGDRVRIEVWDTGIGIAPEHQQSIFQEFYQIGNPERDRQKGLGLGLSIAARLARLLGGRIQVRSQSGHGSVFAVEIPRGQLAPAVVSVNAPAGIADSLHDALVLVVDDDALVCEAVAGLLAQWGCTAVTASSGEEALTVLTRQSRVPDAVLCDYRLPNGETGDQVIRQLRERYGQNLPVALITGDTAPERLRESKESGIPLLHKPVQPARLRALLEHLISSRHERRQLND
jgi:signal transduction histidine kinase